MCEADDARNCATFLNAARAIRHCTVSHSKAGKAKAALLRQTKAQHVMQLPYRRFVHGSKGGMRFGECLLLSAKETLMAQTSMSANDPKRTLRK